ncbi:MULTISPECIES: IS200/IS605 family transposase [Flavobacterium]|uniref:IS200/IS605 family transposase n=1 Tax=Flavobacterium commune TaxID=1306519 RepID=A0A1D9PDX4_9FLAO|nr:MULTISPECIES: IS200/IS605 family transposase [Flavobacterium]APA00781.1 IS200/IS605 family transposase [Flavobacterium commune]
MSKDLRKGSHTVSRLICHVVWVTKYRFKVFKGDVQKRCREILIQICEAEGIEILKGVVSSDHVHTHIEYAPKHNVSSILKSFKGRTSRKLQMEFPELKERYLGQLFWASGYGVWSTGNITDKMVNEYLEHHRRKESDDNSNFILE